MQSTEPTNPLTEPCALGSSFPQSACGLNFTPELEAKILSAIRSGGFPHVAAVAFGVPRPLFKKWLRWGRSCKRPVYHAFAQNVAQAEATARLTAEMEVHRKDPRLWLRAGPGQESPRADGWTSFVRPQARGADKSNLFAAPAFLQLVATLRSVLAPHPEALQAITKAMAERRVG